MGTTRKHSRSRVDFDEMLALAQHDPESFEEKRRAYIEAFLDNIPAEKQRRLRGLQWQIDQTRYLARTPMASCIAISNMMWESLHDLGNQQRALVQLATTQTTHYVECAKPSSRATVIRFPSR